MRTAIYIDGYNLYFGAIKHTKYKWLDVVKLFNGICHIQDPATDITTVKYFTAPVISRVASRGEIALHSQTTYHRALRNSYPGLLEIIEGYFTLEQGNLLKYKKPIDQEDRAAVWRLEEKQSDVNIALSMYRDALSGNYDQVVLVSSDSDLEPALEIISQDVPDIRIGVVFPRKEAGGGRHQRPPNTKLSDLSAWTRSYILDEELANAQFPANIPTKKKLAIRPDYW